MPPPQCIRHSVSFGSAHRQTPNPINISQEVSARPRVQLAACQPHHASRRGKGNGTIQTVSQRIIDVCASTCASSAFGFQHWLGSARDCNWPEYLRIPTFDATQAKSSSDISGSPYRSGPNLRFNHSVRGPRNDIAIGRRHGRNSLSGRPRTHVGMTLLSLIRSCSLFHPQRDEKPMNECP